MRVAPIEKSLKNGIQITLRSPLPRDAPLLVTYVRQLCHESWRNLNRPADGYDKLTVDEEKAWLERFDQAAGEFLICAFYQGKVIGTTAVRQQEIPISTHCSDLGIGALNAYQGIGLGEALLEYAIAQATSMGLWNITLQVRTFNHPAIALYEKLGFARVGTLKAVAKIGNKFEDEYLYQRIE